MDKPLQDALSPYLLQHLDNPVHWHPWGTAALQLAKNNKLPIFLSIGYAACHWCHVMAEESFADPVTADFLNQYFIAIKVDREERPDIDAIYMQALLSMHGHGGWPMSLFLFPDGKPFFGGTYFPKQPSHGLPSFLQLLQNIQYHWQHERQQLQHISQALIQHMQGSIHCSNTYTLDLNQEVQQALHWIDPIHGGTQGAPKFPQIPLWSWLTALAEATNTAALTAALHLTAQKLCQGGIYDHVGGGWMRYSTDEIWLVPHFEKMLYDNAMLVRWLSQLQLPDQAILFEQRINHTIEWLNREMRLTNGCYAASLDADSEHEEGKYYVWQFEEITAILGTDAAAVQRAYDVSLHGNWEGKNILHQNHADATTTTNTWVTALQKLQQVREQRIAPARDDKILADWNSLWVTALAKASYQFNRPDWLALAETTFQALIAALYQQQWYHCRRLDKVLQMGFLEDYACSIEAAIELYSQTHNNTYLTYAIHWTQQLEQYYFNIQQQAFNQCHHEQHDLLTNPINWEDGPTPSGNGLMALNYCKLWLINHQAHDQQQALLLSQGKPSSTVKLAQLWLAAATVVHADLQRLANPLRCALQQRLGRTFLLLHTPNAAQIQICVQRTCQQIPYDLAAIQG